MADEHATTEEVAFEDLPWLCQHATV